MLRPKHDHFSPVPSRATAIVVAIMAGACGDSESAPPRADIPVNRQAPTVAAWTETSVLSMGQRADGVGMDAEGTVRAVQGGLTFIAEPEGLGERPLIVDEGAPSSLGEVRRIRPRVAGGAWLATDTGLWFTEGLFVRHRPTSLTSPGLTDVADIATGPFQGLWLASTAGVYWIRNGEASLLEAQRPARRLAASRSAVALLDNDTVRILTADGDDIYVQDAPFTSALDVAATTNAIFAATETGLYRLVDGSWLHFYLHDSIPMTVTAVVATQTDLWARTSDAIVRLADTASTRYPSVGTGDLAVDRLGNVYAPDADGLIRASSGVIGEQTPTFTQDVLPWIETHCALCHANQTQDFRDYDVFELVAASALSRVRSGDMPRCEGGVRCPPEQNMAAEDYAVLEAWIQAGMPE